MNNYNPKDFEFTSCTTSMGSEFDLQVLEFLKHGWLIVWIYTSERSATAFLARPK